MNEPQPEPATPEYSWTDRAYARAPRRAALAAALIGAAVAAVAALDRWMALVGAVFLLASSAEGLLPIHYRISPEGVERSHLFGRRRQPWRHFSGFERAPDGVRLLGAGPSDFLRRRRALVLRGPDRIERIEVALADYLASRSREDVR